MSTYGPIFGCCAGLLAAFSYLASRHYSSSTSSGPRQLMVLSNVIMAGFSLLLLPFFYQPPVDIFRLTWSLLLVVGAYYGGMTLLFGLLKQVSSSSVTPLLGLKVVVLALIHQCSESWLSLEQWVAVALMVCSSFLLKSDRGGLSYGQMLWALACCCCYALSDFGIRCLMPALSLEPSFESSVMAVCLSYIGAGAFGLISGWHLAWGASGKLWSKASGFAIFWYAHMCCLYIAIATIGLVYSSILQSTRSIWAVALGVLLVHFGFDRIETSVSRSMRLKQAVVAVLMVYSVALYQGLWSWT